MNRWRPAPNPCAWYSLRLISSTDVVLSSTRPTRSEKSELSQPRVSVAWKSRLRKHRSHGFYRTRSGKRRRYRCVECEKTFSSTKGTPYYRLQHRRATFDAVVALRVEGVSISAIARVRRDFLEHCRSLAREGSPSVSSIQPQKDRRVRRRVAASGRDPLFRRRENAANVDIRRDRSLVAALAIDSDRKTKLPKHARSAARRREPDGFRASSLDRHRRIRFLREERHGVRRVFGPAALYGQVLKTRRNDRIVKVERRELIGAAWRFEEVLNNSEDSSTLNTSFIERMNLTIRQGSAYLSRRTLSHARSEEKLKEHLELLRCHYNFVRLDGALKFGRETRTPAMQAGLATRRLTFREVFACLSPSLLVSIGAITCAVPSRLPTAPIADQLLAA